jgi:putative NADH-flavin reductase
MQITIFGASGKVGSLVVEEALRRGHTVVAFVHSRSTFNPSGSLIIRKGDVYNAADVVAAIQGSDAVISCLGSWGTKGRDVLSRFTANVIPAMLSQNMSRIVTLTGVGVQIHPSKLHIHLLNLIRPLPFGKVFYDAENHIRMLLGSSLKWTSVCSPVMNNFGGAGYRLSQRTGNPLGTINRKAVATALLDQLEATEFISQTPVIHRS